MKKIALFFSVFIGCLISCNHTNRQLIQRAMTLCAYVPDHELLASSKAYMTTDFYAVLDTMFHLPEHESLDHEWLYCFVTGNGGTTPNYEVTGVERTDPAHAVATLMVRQRWEDGSFDASSEPEEHKLYMEKSGDRWLMSDFDGHKQDCIDYIANYRREQAVRDAVAAYLVEELGEQYRHSDLCVPLLMMVDVEETDSVTASVWGDFWIFWYRVSGDTLYTESGDNHAGRMTLRKQNGRLEVTAFEQTEDGAGNEASARRIFGNRFVTYRNIHSRPEVREAARQEQLREFASRQGLTLRFYQDAGWETVKF